jgi:hypothetical protein
VPHIEMVPVAPAETSGHEWLRWMLLLGVVAAGAAGTAFWMLQH